MGVWRIPVGMTDPNRHYPKPPPVEKRKCKAYKCQNRRSLSFRSVKDNPWCTDHSRAVYFAGEGWMHPERQYRMQLEARPPTNAFAYYWKRIRVWKSR